MPYLHNTVWATPAVPEWFPPEVPTSGLAALALILVIIVIVTSLWEV